MQPGALCKVLLIQAIEETDRDGSALPLTERVDATRAAAAGAPPAVPTELPVSAASESFLIRRADILLQGLRSRSPGLEHFLAVVGGTTTFDRRALSLAFVLGFLLTWLEGGGGVRFFALPLCLVVAWNVLAYTLLLGRMRKGTAPRATAFGRFYANRVRAQVDNLLDHSMHFNAPLAPGLRRFAADWLDLGQPLCQARARRLSHLCAATVALGLAVGYCFRAFVLRFDVGPQSPHLLLTVLFGPASLLSGVLIPTVESTAATSRWVQLIAWTLGLYVVLPRLLAAGAATVQVWRVSRRLVMPSGIVSYLRTLLAR